MNSLFVLLGIESWKPVLTALLLPPVPLLLMVLVGARLLLPRRGLGWTVIVLSVTLLWFSMCAVTSYSLTRVLLRPPPALNAERIAQLKAEVKAKKPVAIVVLGGGMRAYAVEYGVADLDPLALERLRYAAWLSRETGAPLAYSGGAGWAQREGDLAEAEVGARVAERDFGRTVKWTESRSRDTRENAARTVALLRPEGITHLVVVTHEVHMRRALRAFDEAAQGTMKVEAAPIGGLARVTHPLLAWLPSTTGYANLRAALHEWVGLLMGA